MNKVKQFGYVDLTRIIEQKCKQGKVIVINKKDESSNKISREVSK